MEYDLYAPERDFTAIPDLKLVMITGDERDRSIHFTWRGEAQWLAMSKDNPYGDGFWLVVKTDYTEEFQAWLDENLDGYDSLESTFELSDIISTYYSIEFDN